ncbi:MAG: c-type cytochrome [Verrucomicrobia bacterium]|nr:c-type cytochrome [Verrucomicrobiota bacterium]
MKALLDWFDHRTGARKLLHEALFENIPGGARWRYVWGSMLTFAFSVQVITGLLLWTSYNPSSTTAWESVYYIQHELWGGWFLRGVHHYTAQFMTLLLVLHLMQVVIDGAYKAPREMNFWFGLILFKLVLALSLTGYLLPWDQKGFWATKVATNIAGITPVIGPSLQKLIIGGTDYGHQTLSRFFALHAGILPLLIGLLIVGHIYLFRRHGITAKQPLRKRDAAFWPDQVLKDGVACLALMAAVLFLVIRTRGGELGAPADPTEPFSAARPEWYFLFLFQLLKYFPGTTEIIGAIILPGLAATVVFLMPFIARWRLGHTFNVCFLFMLLGIAGLLTGLALRQDGRDPLFLASEKDAEAQAQRVVELAQSPTGIPPTGAVNLLRNDPLTQGPKIFAKNCASCHRYGGHDGLGHEPTDPPSAPDLKGIGTRAWISGFLDPQKIVSSNYFGGSRHKDGKMAGFVQKKVSQYSNEQRDQLTKVIAALSAEANLESQKELDARESGLIEDGRKWLRSELGCTDCHQFRVKDEDATAPDLTGYGSKDWLVRFISNPAHPDFYGKKNDRMPRYADDGVLTEAQISMVADWLRGEWFRPLAER